MESEVMIQSYTSINESFEIIGKTAAKTAEIVAFFEKKTEEVQKRNTSSFDTLLSKLNSQVQEIASQKAIILAAKNEYYTISENQNKFKAHLSNLMIDLDKNEVTLPGYDQQVRNYEGLREYASEREEIYKIHVEAYNFKMHQLFQNLPQFYNTLSFWDREKECIFFSVNSLLKNRSENLSLDKFVDTQIVTAKFEEIFKNEILNDFVSFQERLQITSKVLQYIQNFSNLKIPFTPWKSPAKKTEKSEQEEEDFDKFFVIEDMSINEEEKEILTHILQGIFGKRKEKDINLFFCEIILDEFFVKENVVRKFLHKVGKKIDLQSKSFFQETFQFELTEKIFLKILTRSLPVTFVNSSARWKTVKKLLQISNILYTKNNGNKIILFEKISKLEFWQDKEVWLGLASHMLTKYEQKENLSKNKKNVLNRIFNAVRKNDQTTNKETEVI